MRTGRRKASASPSASATLRATATATSRPSQVSRSGASSHACAEAAAAPAANRRPAERASHIRSAVRMPSRSCGNHDRLARKFRRQWPTPRLSAWIRPGASTARAGPGGAPAGAGSLREGCPARCGERPGQVRTCRALPRGWRAGRSRGDDGGGPARDGQLAALASSAVWEPGVQRRRLAMSLRPNTRLIRSGRSRPAGPTAHLVISSVGEARLGFACRVSPSGQLMSRREEALLQVCVRMFPGARWAGCAIVALRLFCRRAEAPMTSGSRSGAGRGAVRVKSSPR